MLWFLYIHFVVLPSISASNSCTVMPGMLYSVPSPVALTQSYGHQTEATSLENSASNNDEVASVSLSAQVTQPLELPKPDPVVQQGPHYPYLPPAANYVGFGLVPQMSGGQYGYEAVDSQPPDLSRLPSLMVWFFCFAG
jgi:hypothetical protein